MAANSTPSASGGLRPALPAQANGKKHILLADQAHDAIVDLILSYQLRLGERTSVAQLADRLSLGRTPVKEAIARLEAEGLLSVSGRSGTTVKNIDATTARQLFALRGNLESFAVDDVVNLVTDEQIKGLYALLDQLKWPSGESLRAYQATAPFVRANVKFHAAIVACARNPTLDRLYAQVQLQAQIVVYIYRLTGSHKDEIMNDKYEQHLAIYNAVAARDAGALRTSLHEHAAITEAGVLESLNARA